MTRMLIGRNRPSINSFVRVRNVPLLSFPLFPYPQFSCLINRSIVYSVGPKLTLVIPLPPILDLELLHNLWDNTKSSKNELPTPYLHLTQLGDSQLSLLARLLSPDLFGHNYHLTNTLYDYLKDNLLFASLGRVYGLHTWLRQAPLTNKEYADVFEGWVGAVIMDRLTWDGGGMEGRDEVQRFMREVWKLRYRGLARYSRSLVMEFSPKEGEGEFIPSTEEDKIVFPLHESIQSCFAPSLNRRAAVWGHWVTLQLPSGRKVNGFGVTVKEAQSRARRFASAKSLSHKSLEGMYTLDDSLSGQIPLSFEGMFAVY